MYHSPSITKKFHLNTHSETTSPDLSVATETKSHSTDFPVSILSLIASLVLELSLHVKIILPFALLVKVASVPITNILSLLDIDFDNANEAKEFRCRVRRAMIDEKTGWGWICWGNCGTTEFVRALCTWPPREREEARDELHHTESD